MGLFFRGFGPKGEAHVNSSIKQSIGCSNGGGAFSFRPVFVIERLSVGKRDPGWVCIDPVLVNDRVGNVGSVVVGAPRGLGLESEIAIGKVEVVVAEDSFSIVLTGLFGVAFREGDEETFGSHGSIRNLDEAFFLGSEQSFGEGLLPDDLACGCVETDGEHLLPVIFGALAAGCGFLKVGVACFKKAKFAFCQRDSRVDDEPSRVGPVSVPV